MKENQLGALYNKIMFDLDTICIEQTSIEDPDKSSVILHLLKEVSNIIKERIYG